MIPLYALIGTFVICVVLGQAGVTYFHDWHHAIRAGFGAMLLVTASALWGRLRPDLIRMVPPAFPEPGLLVTLSGICEILGAIGLQIPKLAPLVAICLALLLGLMFPANIYAAKEKLTIGGRPVPGLIPRIIVQISFFAALWYAGTGK